MRRRLFLQTGLVATLGTPLLAALDDKGFEGAAQILQRATESGQVHAAVLHVQRKDTHASRHFGQSQSKDAMFLLGSISKPICVTALMTLYDQGEFQLTDRARRYLPEFTGSGRDDITILQLLTHVSGLPDQLPNNNALRAAHAPQSEFVKQALRTPLLFAPGTRYQYSSMAILLATHIAERISGVPILELVDRTVLQPLGMKHSAAGKGHFQLEQLTPVQTERAAVESGAGDPGAKNWDWNSPYWRGLGATWGGVHASAPDVARFLHEFLSCQGQAVKPETARLMTRNHNPSGLTPRGLGFNVGKLAGSPGCSERTFGHTGSTGTLCWADPATETICVVLTSLPGRAVQPHPRELAAAKIAEHAATRAE